MTARSEVYHRRTLRWDITPNLWDWSPNLTVDDIKADLEAAGGDYDALFREYERQAWEDVKVILFGDGDELRRYVEEHEEKEEEEEADEEEEREEVEESDASPAL